MKNNKLKTTKEYLKEVRNKYNETYDLSKVVYVNAKTKVIVGCSRHGYFEQEASYFVNKSLGCPACSLSIKDKCKLTTAEFIRKAKIIHKDKFNYRLVKYIDTRTKVKILCPTHGVFEQTPNNHLRARGCNLCRFNNSTSKAENELVCHLKDLGLSVITNCRPSWLNSKELDLYIPTLNLAIEYNGFVYHHTSDSDVAFLSKTKVYQDYHYNKWKVCKDNGVTLIHIFEFEDIEEWKVKLTNLIAEPNNYKVTFTNNLRTISMYNKTLQFYGISNIITLPDK